MKPLSRKALQGARFINGNFTVDFGANNTVASIQGATRKLGQNYKDTLVVLYNKATFLPVAARKPNENGMYSFFGLNTDLTCFIVGFDNQKKYNAVIQDNVVPK